MRLIRCVVQPGQVDEIVDALKGSGVSALTVIEGAGWGRHARVSRMSYRANRLTRSLVHG